ncbi:lysoplasmalogenase [Salinibacterium sp. NSLL150]|uniref:lysoplasmalogenase family protein n=1 Tax=unclassified Salinibacterium TaxID=2632331 RepID=UPI0018CD5CD4|nr:MULTISPECIES: lysoplasmalogenase family protein [unclassified Salinibacterium]MBH0100113.1 lysoplasmalogenase [Salinibacterium sp. NSLL35]MBH0102867.1 lysoplasmalogenase [Salinibacterium sp. NSLL150]MBH0105627.1 lysoplasmalogenase [Salinibacterium sp. NSLL16]MBH0108387.1 lysoplasmalogenase [Salinibacterium sp. NSLL17]
MVNFRWCGIYVAVAIVHVVSLLAGWDAVANPSKFLLMPTLGVGVILATARGFRWPDYAFIGALTLAWVGDIFVADAASSSFIIGLAAFLAAHAVYLVLFLKAVRSRRVPWATAVLLVWWVGLLVVLRADLGSFFVPLAAYGAVLAASTASAFATTRLIATGAVLFLASDTALAWALFAPAAVWWQSDALIMTLYTGGQLLIAVGFVAARRGSRNTASVSG